MRLNFITTVIILYYINHCHNMAENEELKLKTLTHN